MVIVLSASGEFIQIYGFIIYSNTVMAPVQFAGNLS